MTYTITIKECMSGVERFDHCTTIFPTLGDAFKHADFQLSHRKKYGVCAYIHLHDEENGNHATITIMNPYKKA